jgi:hypothetical protein
MIRRLHGIAAFAGCLALTVGTLCAWAEENPGSRQSGSERNAAAQITPATEQAIARGLAFLVSRQHPDGSFGSGGYSGNVAVVSLCGMAMMSNGTTPGRGPFGKQVNLCLDYVLANTQESGFISAPNFVQQGPMYGHGFAAMFLAECYGASPRPEVREKLSRAVRLIVNTQSDTGGWRYLPQRSDPDISVTICQVMALRAAKNAGIHVPREVVDRSIDYIKRSQNADGGFMYMLSQGGESAFPRSAAAVVGLFSAGIYEGPVVDKGLKYLANYRPQPGVAHRVSWFYYGHYYAGLAMWQVGGETWNGWFPAIRDDLLGKQQPNGSWTDPSVSSEFGTAMACLILQMPNDCLPIFQR